LTTFKAKGQLPDAHPLAGGVLGRSGTPIASYCMNESDLLIVFGASFSNHTGISPYKSIIQVDRDPMAIGKFHEVTVPVLGDVGRTARALVKQVGPTETVDQREQLAHRWELWREEKRVRRQTPAARGVNYATVFHELGEAIDPDAIITVDVGNNTYAFGRYFEPAQQRVLMSGYLGSIGFAFPAAMGAYAATTEPDEPFHGRQVVSISSDGGFGQYLAEFTTAVKYDMDITHLLLNDDELGKISKEQRTGGWAEWQTSLVNPGFAEFAENCGGQGIRVQAPEELSHALETALTTRGPSLIEIITDADPI
jgi:thiamine pyrophosphate-dependent acetolactate synthase large subunit-like protein